MPILIGANPIGWSNDDMPELGAETTLETCLAQAREIGFEGMELGHKFPREPSALRAALAPFGLACVSGWYGSELMRRDAREEIEAVRPHLALLQAMECRVMVFADVSGTVHADRSRPLPARPVLTGNEWRRFGARLTEVGDALADAGVALAYHHHMGTVVQTRDDIARLMDVAGASVRLLLDTGHATWGGADPAALARTWRTRIVHVHAKDVRPDVARRADEEGWSFLDAVRAGVYAVPGDGCVDFGAVSAALPDYEGWIVMEAEQDPARADPFDHGRRGYAHLRNALGSRA